MINSIIASKYNMKIILSIGVVILAVYLDGKVSEMRSYVHIASIFIDSLPSLIAAFFIPLAYVISTPYTNKTIKNQMAIVAGFFAYELIQYFIPQSVFDIYDLLYTLVGGLLSVNIVFIFRLIFNVQNKEI